MGKRSFWILIFNIRNFWIIKNSIAKISPKKSMQFSFLREREFFLLYWIIEHLCQLLPAWTGFYCVFTFCSHIFARSSSSSDLYYIFIFNDLLLIYISKREMQSTLLYFFLPAILASLLTLLSDISFYACMYAKSQECLFVCVSVCDYCQEVNIVNYKSTAFGFNKLNKNKVRNEGN